MAARLLHVWFILSSRMASSSNLSWYAHRLKAMSVGEIVHRFGERWKHQSDAKFADGLSKITLGEPDASVPALPNPGRAPITLRQRLMADARALLQGDWKLYGWREASTGSPPCWHRDASTGVIIEPDELSHKLDHRTLPDGADARTIWEINRWSEMTRVVMHGWLNRDVDAVRTAQLWLEDWCDRNPVGRGINWTSTLEAALRLINFTWFDAIVHACGVAQLSEHQRVLAQRIVPAHVAWVYRYRSFGSSANNHLLGELAGLIHAVKRWPSLAEHAGSAEELWQGMSTCVLEQFAPDGGNREQALHYHLFAWEMAWHSARLVNAEDDVVWDRLAAGAEFFVRMVHPLEPWDYGDSDDAQVLPIVLYRGDAMSEWQSWIAGHDHGRVLAFWMGESPLLRRSPVHLADGWWLAKESGMAVCELNDWVLRLNAGPTGYGSLAAHGHCDALHLSIWDGMQALVIDPGTGSYYGMKERRAELSAWEAHNGPRPATGYKTPHRFGMFLLSGHYAQPEVMVASPRKIGAQFKHEGHCFVRTVDVLNDGAICVEDHSASPAVPLCVTWMLAPECEIESEGQWVYRISRGTSQWRVQIRGGELLQAEIGEMAVSRSYGMLESAKCLTLEARSPLRTEWRRA